VKVVAGTLFKNALLVTMNPEKEVINTDLMVEDTAIKAIGPNLGSADRVIDAAGKVYTRADSTPYSPLPDTFSRSGR
jgi:cytosine/adenosine deaminase-related metal-dependent hydrolase